MTEKSELMLIRRASGAIAYSSFCSQIILVYVYSFSRIHFSAAENCKKK